MKDTAAAPLRLFCAGVADALSTWFEARANQASDTDNYIGSGYRRTLAGMAIARKCFETLMEDARTAKADLEAGKLSEAVENVIEANILLSGLGFENTG
ncbi:MAG: iron-containing alcohol dehydrogenase [Lachnospiraceae bacterium]|nr:iron-containing alcohol dehydrogenase [Lachnospiraceae bacterium]